MCHCGQFMQSRQELLIELHLQPQLLKNKGKDLFLPGEDVGVEDVYDNDFWCIAEILVFWPSDYGLALLVHSLWSWELQLPISLVWQNQERSDSELSVLHTPDFLSLFAVGMEPTLWVYWWRGLRCQCGKL